MTPDEQNDAANVKEMGPPKNNTGLKRILNAFFFSIQGFKACLKEDAFRHEVCLTGLMIPLAFFIGQTPVEYILLIGSVVLVLVVELLNTAVERAIDRISFEKHELSKEAKDMGSAAVFLMLVLAGFVWAMIVLSKLF